MATAAQPAFPPLCPVKGGDFCDGYVIVPDSEAAGGDVAMTLEQATAAIRALQLHDELVAACRLIIAVADYAGNPWQRINTATDAARAVIAKAESR